MLIPDISEDEIKDFLITRKGKLGGVCITGGEPCMWKSNLAEFMRWCKAEGFKVKLDTNGSFPDVLNEYLSKGLVDYIAMDIKNSFSKYAKTVGLDSVNLDKIKLSVEIIKKSRIPHTFRTTVVPSLIEAYDLSQIEEFLGEKLILQDYRPVSNYSEVNYG
jgi:pyruvate formate lyase activating enzyme